MSEHALLSASGAQRWSTCPASLKLTADLPRTSNKYADEGTAAHELAAWCLLNDKQPVNYPEPTITVGDAAYDVEPMIEPVGKYLKVVRDYALNGGKLLVEQKVDYSAWIGAKDSFGTSDAVILHDDRITICDLKYGQGVKVDAQENEQLQLYALGALYEYEMLGDFKEVVMVIIQPRLNYVSEFVLDVTSLKTFALKMKAAAIRALSVYNSADDPAPEHYQPSDHGCRFCAAKGTCPALRAEVIEETRNLFAAFVDAPEGTEITLPTAQVPEDTLGHAMGLVDRVEGWCKAIRAEVERRLLAGQPVQGYKLIEGRRGPRGWKDSEAAEKALRRLLGAKDALVYKPISPTQVEDKFVKKGLLSDRQWATLCKNIESSDGKPSVAPESDRGTPIVIQSTEDRFASLAVVDASEFV